MNDVDNFIKKLLNDDSHTIIIRHQGGPEGGPPDIREKVMQLCYGLSQTKHDNDIATSKCLILSSSLKRAKKLLEFLCQDRSIFEYVNRYEYRLSWKDRKGYATLKALSVGRDGNSMRSFHANIVIIEDANNLPKGSFCDVYYTVRLWNNSTVICMGNERKYGKTLKDFEEACRNSKLVYGNPLDQLYGGDSSVQYYLRIGDYPIIGYENLES